MPKLVVRSFLPSTRGVARTGFDTGGGGGGLGTHWSEDEGGDWGSVGEALRAVWVVGSVGLVAV